MEQLDTWKFDSKVAEVFPTHARQHIPNYDQVIKHCIDVANLHDKNSKIIDVGCAVGETLIKLQQHGFTNLYGVDYSQSMLDRCPSNIAKLICSDNFPTEHAPFDIVLMNWTLHFIKNKVEYLCDIYNSLPPDGILILTEKTSNDQLPLEFYHQFKRSNGVSDQEIKQKAQSLESVMHYNDVPWYFKHLLEIGFTKVYIFNAHWCFTSFIAIK